MAKLNRNYNPQFLAPTGPGKPRNEANIPLGIDDFSDGIDVGLDTMAARGVTVLRVNANSVKRRTLDRRLGYTQAGTGGVGKVYMGGSLQIFDGNDINLRMVTSSVSGVQLQYDNAGTWTDLGSNISNSSNRVDWFGTNAYISDENRFYFCNGVDTLRYTDGSSISTVTDTQDIKAKYITTVGNVLVLGHFTETFGANEMILAKAGTHQFRRDQDTDFATSTTVISLASDEITQLASFNWLVYAFTRGDGLFEIDPNTEIPRKIGTHGTLAPKSVATGEDLMVWADQSGVWAISSGSGSIYELSEPIQELYESISASNVLNMNGGISPGGDYFLSVGDITFDGVDYTDACLVYHIKESRRVGSHVWSLYDNFPSNYWWNHTNSSGVTNQYFGSIDTTSVFVNSSGTDDDGADISLVWESKDFPIFDENYEATLTDFYLKYKPDTSEAIPITVSFRRDVGEWDEFDSKTLSLPASTKRMAFVHISTPAAITGRTLGFKIESSDDIPFRIYDVMALYNLNESNIPLT